MKCTSRMQALMPSQSSKDMPKPNVTAIAEVNGKVLVTLDNGMYFEADMSVVDKNLNTDIQAREEMNSLKQQVASLETFKTTLLANLMTVKTLDELDSFKAFNLTFNQ